MVGLGHYPLPNNKTRPFEHPRSRFAYFVEEIYCEVANEMKANVDRIEREAYLVIQAAAEDYIELMFKGAQEIANQSESRPAGVSSSSPALVLPEHIKAWATTIDASRPAGLQIPIEDEIPHLMVCHNTPHNSHSTLTHTNS